MQIIEAVYERDIDLLLVEEFFCDIEFIRHFLRETPISLPLSIDSVSVKRSVTDKTGETDIVVEYHSLNGRICLLIENKIDANFQPGQIERYRDRKKTIAYQVYTVLIAPYDYLNGVIGFDYTVSYESLIPFFETRDRRGKYKIELLRIAIDKLRRGYQPVNDELNLRFQKYYFTLVQRTENLIMEEPKVKPTNSTWIRSKHRKHPMLDIIHKLNHNRIDIYIPNSCRELYAVLIDSYGSNGGLIEVSNGCYLRFPFYMEVDTQNEPDLYAMEIEQVLNLIEGVFIKAWL